MRGRPGDPGISHGRRILAGPAPDTGHWDTLGGVPGPRAGSRGVPGGQGGVPWGPRGARVGPKSAVGGRFDLDSRHSRSEHNVVDEPGSIDNDGDEEHRRTVYDVDGVKGHRVSNFQVINGIGVFGQLRAQ